MANARRSISSSRDKIQNGSCRSSALFVLQWIRVKLSRLHRHVDRALEYFQSIDVRELVSLNRKATKQYPFTFAQDLSESFLEPPAFRFKNDLYLYSLRSLCISTDHPLEFFTLLCKLAPYLQYIQLVQPYNPSLKRKTTKQLYDCVNFVIYQCEERLKCLRRLHMQLRSVSDQVRADLQSPSMLIVDQPSSDISRSVVRHVTAHILRSHPLITTAICPTPPSSAGHDSSMNIYISGLSHCVNQFPAHLSVLFSFD